jgi:hydroxymethylbilane synthase
MARALTLRVGTRTSDLAMWQARHVASRMSAHAPDISIVFVPMRTLGDDVRDVPLAQLGDRGVFTRDIEDALRANEIDIAVHSLKDLPIAPAEGVEVGAILRRGDPRECLVSRAGGTLAQLPPGARIGTSSPRRRAQVLRMRPDVTVAEIRGNVPTRISKAIEGRGVSPARSTPYDAVVLAAAGLSRLDRLSEASEVFEIERFLPAPGQGAIAVQVRAGDRETKALVGVIEHVETKHTTTAERMVLSTLHGGCHAPLAAYGRMESSGLMRLTALVARCDGQLTLRSEACLRVSTHEEAVALGRDVGNRLRDQGADSLISKAL